jgi:hypothetical protein
MPVSIFENGDRRVDMEGRHVFEKKTRLENVGTKYIVQFKGKI